MATNAVSPTRSRTRRAVRALLGGLALSWLLLGGAVEGLADEIPETLESRQAPGALWISAEKASTPEGELLLEIFPPGDRPTVETEIRQVDLAREHSQHHDQPMTKSRGLGRSPYLAESLCVSSSVVFSHPDEVPRGNLAELERYARAIFSGRISAIEQGFVAGLPASLFAVELDAVLKHGEEYSPGRTVYVVYPYAAFRIGERVFCRNEPSYSYRPQIGDRILLFPAAPPADLQGLTLRPVPAELLAEKPDGSLYVPEALEDRESLRDLESLETVEERVQELRSARSDENRRRP